MGSMPTHDDVNTWHGYTPRNSVHIPQMGRRPMILLWAELRPQGGTQ